MTLQAGTHLGPYEILAPLGAGGMGEVYRAKDKRLEREVAVKVLPEQFASDATALARFEREAKAIAALSHPNILAIHDVGTEQGTSFVVTELLEGETLRGRLRQGALPWRKVAEIGAAIAGGLAAAHARGIIHRDLKPGNIFLTSDGVVKILDFGLARRVGETLPKDLAEAPTLTVATKPGAVMGTPAYMSPEQVRGQRVDARSDVFSFGCVLYEMVTGDCAFPGDTPAELIAAILRDEPRDVSESGKAVPPELEHVIRHCLEKKPEERFQSARDLAFDLRSIVGVGAPRSHAAVWVAVSCVGVVALVAVLVAVNVGGWRERLFSEATAVPTERIESLAELPPIPITAVPPPSPWGGRIAQRWAVVIGVSEYADHRIPKLNYAARDARAFYDWLTSAEGGRYAKAHVHLLLNKQATRQNIHNALIYGLRRALEEDLVVIYFSGHGTPESPDKLDMLYLLPSDVDYEFIATTAFPMEDIGRALAKHIPARRVVIIADACHAGGVGEGFSTARRAVGLAAVSQLNEGLHALARDDAGHSVAVFTSADTDELSQEDRKWGGGHGVFTFYLLEGLRGEADSTGDGHANLGELSVFVSEGVRNETNGAQRPRMAGNFDPSLVIGE